MTTLRIIWIALLFAITSFASCPNFQSGIDAYKKEDYSKALELWESCQQAGLQNADLYYNLGNAAFRLDQIGKAVWAYESALRLDPTNSDAAANLKFAQNQTVDKVENAAEDNPVLKALWKLHHLFSLNTQLWILVLLAWLAASIYVALHWVRKASLRNLMFLKLFGIGVLATLFALDTIAKIYIQETETPGIVLTKNADIMSGPGDNYQVLHELHEGTRVEVREVRGEWANVRIGDNVNGFMPVKLLGIVR